MWPVEFLYIFIISLRNSYYSHVYKAPNVNSLPYVISVGNISTGGTGKTPICLEIFGSIANLAKTAVLLRGYSNDTNKLSDEALIYQKHLGDENVFIGANRLESLKKCKSTNHSIAILDDGFQHRKAHRHLNIAIIDMTRPLENQHCLPRGFLREPISSLKRADWIIFNRTNLVSDDYLNETHKKYSKKFSHVVFFKSKTALSELNIMNNTSSNNSFNNYLIVCGLGNPENFLESVKNENLKVKNEIFFPDHHPYNQSDLDHISKTLEERSIDAVITTEKDWVKWTNLNVKFNVLIFDIRCEIEAIGDKDFKNELQKSYNSKIIDLK